MNRDIDNEIIYRQQRGQSIRGIARDLGISRRRVSRTISLQQQAREVESVTAELPRPSKKRSSKLDGFEETIQQLLARYSDMKVTRMLQELQRQGYTGGYTILREHVKRLRRQPNKPLVVRFETPPGLQAQMDWSVYDIDFTQEGRRRVNLFSYLLSYSRRQYMCFTERQDFDTAIREHIRAFEYLQGLAATCLYDNMKVVVTRYDGDEPVYNSRFLGFATHYGYRPVACRPRRSQTKGKVERPFHYVEKNLLNGRTFQSLEHLNDVLRTWLREKADVRIHRETKERPLDRYHKEQPHLIPLPDHPYDTAEVVYRCVSVEGVIVYCQNRYSVPWRYIGLTLPVRITEQELIVYGPQIEEIARHPLFSRHVTGQAQLAKAHQPRDEGEKKYEVLKQRYEELGSVAVRFLEGLVQHRRYGKDEAHKILALLETYHRHDLLAAIERAVRYGAYSRSAIERILAIQATPKTALDTLAEKEQQQLSSLLGDDPVRPRSGKDYQKLLDLDHEHNDEASEQNAEEDDGENDAPPDSHESGDQDRPDEDDDADCAGIV